MKSKIFNRKVHRWASVITALPVLVVLLSGILLQVKKQSDWVQPPAQTGSGTVPQIEFAKVLTVMRGVAEANVQSWQDIDRIDVRPEKGMMKVLAVNDVEVQLDSVSGEVLQVALRRSGLIEALHDGSFFHEQAKLWVFLPSAIVLLVIWLTGIYLFVVHQRRRNKNKSLSAKPLQALNSSRRS